MRVPRCCRLETNTIRINTYRTITVPREMHRRDRRRPSLAARLVRMALLALLANAATPTLAQILPRELDTPPRAPLIPAPPQPGAPAAPAYDPNTMGMSNQPGMYAGPMSAQAGWMSGGAPTAPSSGSRPAAWPGGQPPRGPRAPRVMPGGESLSGAPLDRDLDPEAARAARAQWRQRSRPLGGPPSPPPNPITGPIAKVLASEYELAGRDLAPADYAGPTDLYPTEPAIFDPGITGPGVASSGVAHAGGPGAGNSATATPGGGDPNVVQAQYVDPSGAPQVITGPSSAGSGRGYGPAPPMSRHVAPRSQQPRHVARLDDSARQAALSQPEAEALIRSEPDDEIGPTTILARVEQQVIIAGDVLPDVHTQMLKNAKHIPKGQVKAVRRLLMQRRLEELVKVRLIYIDAMREIPDKAHDHINKMMAEQFEKQALPEMLSLAQVENRLELDNALRRNGTTLDIEKRVWIEGEMAKSWLGQHLKFDEEITHQEMLDFYRRNPTEYEVKAAVLWEEIKVPYRGAQERAAVWQRLAMAGNQVLAGRPLADVAKEISTGATASTGGRRDWTNLGSLVNKQLEDTLFQLPVNQLSNILDDEKALYIVRVLERREAGTVPFTEAQGAIREKIREQNLLKQQKEFFELVRGKFRVWTIFDGTPDPVTGAMPPASLAELIPPQTSAKP